jgi:hypothetical protein
MALFFKKGLELPPAPQRPVMLAEPKHTNYLELPPPSQSVAKPETMESQTQPISNKMPEFPPMPRESIPSSIPHLALRAPAERSSIMMMHPSARKDVFVDVSQYSTVLGELDKLKSVISKGQSTLNGLMSMKSEEDAEFERWRNVLEDMERKLLFIDKTLFEK